MRCLQPRYQHIGHHLLEHLRGSCIPHAVFREAQVRLAPSAIPLPVGAPRVVVPPCAFRQRLQPKVTRHAAQVRRTNVAEWRRTTAAAMPLVVCHEGALAMDTGILVDARDFAV